MSASSNTAASRRLSVLHLQGYPTGRRFQLPRRRDQLVSRRGGFKAPGGSAVGRRAISSRPSSSCPISRPARSKGHRRDLLKARRPGLSITRPRVQLTIHPQDPSRARRPGLSIVHRRVQSTIRRQDPLKVHHPVQLKARRRGLSIAHRRVQLTIRRQDRLTDCTTFVQVSL